MIGKLWESILKLFGKKTQTSDKEYERNSDFANEYEDIFNTNITAIFAGKLAGFVTDESILEIVRENKRAEVLDDILEQVDKDKKKIVSRILGTGGIVLLPYIYENKVYYNKVAQNRFSINRKQGQIITDATILADMLKIGYTTQYRWTDYKLENSNLVIENRYTNDKGTPISKPTFWESIEDTVIIPNVERLPLAYIKSPIDNRLTTDLYGVPVTYGSSKTMNKILRTLEQIEREYDLKEAFVGADATMFDGKNALPASGLYRKIDSGEDYFWEVFDPAIRDSAYFNKLEAYFALLEKEVGTSRGVLTDPISTYQNVDEVRRALRDTLSIVNAVREQFEIGIKEFLDGCEVLINYHNIAPQGEYQLNIVWSYSMIEDYQTTFSQYMIGLDKGLVSKAEARNLLMDESLEESEDAIKVLITESPTTKDLLGVE